MSSKNKHPIFSVVVTTYNRKELLKETLSSILIQSYTNFELIVVDNYSEYEFTEFIKSFKDDRIRAYQNQNDGIIAVNRNYGIDKSEGQYIAFCDDDDVWESDKLEVIKRVIDKNEIEFVFSTVKYIDCNSRIISGPLKIYSSSAIGRNSEQLVINNIITLSTVIVSKKLLAKTRFMQEKDFVAAEDLLLWLDLNSRSEIYYCSTPLVRYRIHHNNISSSRIGKFQLRMRVLNYISTLLQFDPKLIKLAKLFSEIKYQYNSHSQTRNIYLLTKLLLIAVAQNRLPLIIRSLLTLKK
jgi:teichuronic acid biosynthesis glycosyltransferase TuaG